MMHKPYNVLNTVSLSETIADVFKDLYRDIIKELHTHYYIYGGRGSTKSSFISLVVIMLLLKDPTWCFGVFRKVGDTIADSVKAQIVWAINILGLERYFEIPDSLHKITYIPTGQVIYFRGLDKAKKRKGFIVPPGMKMKLVWFEEFDEFSNAEEIRSVRQSLGRGSNDKILFLYSWNPPAIADHWVYKEADKKRPDAIAHHSTYLDVPEEWIGHTFINEARALMELDPKRYEHEYLGKATDFRGRVFYSFSKEKNIIQSLKENERVLYYICGVDGAIEKDATAAVVLGVTNLGRLVRTDRFYYDPKSKGNYPLAPSRQVDLIIKWLTKDQVAKSKGLPEVTKENSLWVFDSASSDLRREFEFKTGANAIVVDKKSIQADTARMQNLIAEETLVYLEIKDFKDPNTGYIIKDYDPNIYEIEHYIYDENRTGKIPDGQDDHSIDATKYATKYFNHPEALHRHKENITTWK
jgi:PBSX family phage terminase large subunit